MTHILVISQVFNAVSYEIIFPSLSSQNKFLLHFFQFFYNTFFSQIRSSALFFNIYPIQKFPSAISSSSKIFSLYFNSFLIYTYTFFFHIKSTSNKIILNKINNPANI